jgi:hypothetical protein
MKLVKGPGLYFLKPFERLTANGIQDAIALKPQEYVKLLNKKTGAIRIQRGEALVFLAPYEVAEEGVKEMVVVDETHACLIRDIRTGKQQLIIEPQMFAPSEYQEIVVSQQNLVVLKEYEVIVLVDKQVFFFFLFFFCNFNRENLYLNMDGNQQKVFYSNIFIYNLK